jgi:hypothetical protein
MARPHKQTVDYFPHDTNASHGKTLTILYNKFGNSGTAFWWNLLELLGRTPGHFYDFNSVSNLEYLSAETHQKDTETTCEMMLLLANLDAIDQTLYKNKIIWCQNLVERVGDAYARAKDGLPQKPVNVNNNELLYTKTTLNATETIKNDTEIQQTKLKETKLNKESKRKLSIPLKEQVEIIALELKTEYPELDWDHQMIKFRAYWFEGKKQLQRPKLALLNWMDKAREDKKQKSPQFIGADNWPK